MQENVSTSASRIFPASLRLEATRTGCGVRFSPPWASRVLSQPISPATRYPLAGRLWAERPRSDHQSEPATSGPTGESCQIHQATRRHSQMGAPAGRPGLGAEGEINRGERRRSRPASATCPAASGAKPRLLLPPTGITARKRAVAAAGSRACLRRRPRQHLREIGTAWQRDLSLGRGDRP